MVIIIIFFKMLFDRQNHPVRIYSFREAKMSLLEKKEKKMLLRDSFFRLCVFGFREKLKEKFTDWLKK